MQVSYTYSGNIYKPGGGVTDFALVSTKGNEIKYLDKSHIGVAKSTDSAGTWTELARPGEWDFDSTGKKVVLKTATVAGEWIRVKRTTPYSDRYTTFQESSLLTSEQLNEGEDFSMFVDQELFDVQEAASGVLPGLEGMITQEEAEKDPDNPSWAGDKLLATVGAIERIFANIVGKGTGYPGGGNRGKLGKIRIDDDQSVPNLFFWNTKLSPAAWQQVSTQGQAGQQGPKGDPPGLQDPATSVSNVANKPDGTAGDATAAVTQDNNGDLKFDFGVPVGPKGATGADGSDGNSATVDVDSTVTGNPGTDAKVENTGTTSAATFKFTIPRGSTGATGPAPGLQSPAAIATNVDNKDPSNVGDATAKVTKNGSDELLFEFGIPVGLKGDKGDTGSGVSYRGARDFTNAGEEPATKFSGDFYVNTTDGSAAWPGMGGAAVEAGDRTIWNDVDNQWDLVETPPAERVDLGYAPDVDRGQVTNTVGTNATIPAVSGTNAGLMLPAQSTKLDGIETGAEANWDEPADDGSLYARTRAAGDADGSWQQIPSDVVTAVTGGSGITVTGTDNRKVEVSYGQGVEASAAGDTGSLTIKLDGGTLAKGANGLKVADDYNAPTAGSAAQLTTARTLWGQSFDGTANVSGDLSDVGDITGSGAIEVMSSSDGDITLTPHGNGTIVGNSGATFGDEVIVRGGNAIQLNNTGNTQSVKHLAAGALATDAVYTWPAAPNSNRILQSASTGVLNWVDPSSIGGISEAPVDGKQYARKNAGWSEVTGGGGSGGTTINYSGAAAWGSISLTGQLLGGLNCTVASDSTGFGWQITFDTPMPNANYAITACGSFRNQQVTNPVYQNVTPNGFTLYLMDKTGIAQPAAVTFAVHALNALPPQGGTGADAWVEFDGLSAVGTDCTIRAGFNVSRVEHIQTGAYTIHFTNPMPTSNYATFNNANVNINTSNVGGVSPAGVVNSTTSYTIRCAGGETSTPFDCAFVSSMVHCTNAQLPDTVTQEQIEAAINNPGVSAWGLIDMNAQLSAGMNCRAESSDDGYGFKVTFDNPMPNANYAITACAATRVGVVSDVAWTDNTPNGFTLYVKDQSGAAVQAGVSFAVHATNALPPRGGTGADAWVSCKADGTTESSFNIASVTKSATGKYDLVFTTPMPTADYAITTAAGFGSSASVFVLSKTTTGCQIGVFSDITQAYLDMDFNAVVHATNAQLPDTVTQEQIDAILANPNVSAWGKVASDGTLNGGSNCTVTQAGTGTYRVNFINPMPNANYSVTGTAFVDGSANLFFEVDNNSITANGFEYIIISFAGGATGVGYNAAASFVVAATNALPPRGGTGADAWVLCNSDGTTQSSFNIASTTRTGLGLYDVVFTTPMPSADYSVLLTIAAETYSVVAYNTARTVNGFSIEIANSNNQHFDFDFSAVVHATNAQLPDTITMQMWDDLVARVDALESTRRT